ncbi:MAG: VpsF family polysaccharide biosynthesis protein [Beijerinckiaceae bacterium]|nr:VpsF family polysaccharide biosynthesis protein [Beijerinckiaceae bacterium]
MNTPLRDQGMDGFIGRMMLVLMVVHIMVSPMALSALGWNYEAPGGAGPTRFHPSSYFALLLFALLLLRHGNPILGFWYTFMQDPRFALFLVAWVLLLYHAVVNQQLPAAAPVDTFLIPLLVILIFRQLNDGMRHRMEGALHIIFVLNALLGLAEFLTGLRLTPYVAGGVHITDDWRSTAFLGHPLTNALMTGCYTLMLLLGGGPRLTGGLRYGMIGLQFAGMVAFGGRASLVLLVLAGLVALTRGFLKFLAGSRLPLRYLTLVGVLVPLLVAALGVLAVLGFFDKLLLRFVEDNGSANARIVMFELFNGFTWPELLFGPPQVNLTYFVHVYKLEFGIESLWVAFLLFYGVVPAIMFLSGFIFFLFGLMARCQARGWVVLGYYFLVNSTFLGIAGKSTSVTTLSLMLLLMLPRHLPQIAPPQPVLRYWKPEAAWR